MHTALIDAGTLAGLLEGQAPPALFDCRFDLSRPEWGRAQYRDGHVPGAVYVDLEKDLSGPPLTDAGRHPLPSADALIALFSRLGIDGQTQVVTYDQRDGAVASRLWWLLRYMGHRAVAVLDGGFAAWAAMGGALARGDEQRTPARFDGTPRDDRLVRVDQVATLPRLIDARQGARYRGEVEPLDPVAGHIPGARNLPYQDNLDANGRFLPPAQVRARIEAALASVPAEAAGYSCGSGVTACHLLLAAEHAGLAEGRLYVGSFSEWCRDPQRPVATGSDPGTLTD